MSLPHPHRVGRLALFILSIAGFSGLLCGCTVFPTRSQQVWRSLTHYDYPSEPAGGDAFEAALDRYTGSSISAGNAARLLQNGDDAYPAMLELIASAQTRISFETYIIEKDETTNRFFAALAAASKRGVEVRFLADAAGYNRGLVARLDDLNGDHLHARIFNPLLLSWTLLRGNNRDHRKILVVDGRHAVIGGINLSDKQLGDGVSGWRDTSLLVSGPAAAEAEKVFSETWKQAGRGWLGKNLPLTCLNPVKRTVDEPLLNLYEKAGGERRFMAPPYEAPDSGNTPDPTAFDTVSASVRVVSSSPDRRNSPTYDLAILGVLGARERVDIACAYFVPPLGLQRALLAAAKRGVRIRLLLPGVTDVRWVREMGMRFYGEMLRAGVRIYEWPHPILHTKTMAVDGRWLVVGSANMDSRSYFLNYEACFAATDAALAEKAHAQFEKDLSRAKQLTLEAWEARGGRQRLREVLLTPLSGQY